MSALGECREEAEVVKPPPPKGLTELKVYAALRKGGLRRFVRAPGISGVAGHGSGDVRVAGVDSPCAFRVDTYHGCHGRALAALERPGSWRARLGFLIVRALYRTRLGRYAAAVVGVHAYLQGCVVGHVCEARKASRLDGTCRGQ